ncbi:MAG: hypothetical protein V1874_15885 [Spirochaetota bacterium]
MVFSTTEVFGFSESLIEFIRNSAAVLTEKGINTEAWLTELDERKKAAVSLNDEQEKMKASMKELTARSQQSVNILYDAASTRLDAIIGALGKKTESGKQAAKIRSKVRVQRKKIAEKTA